MKIKTVWLVLAFSAVLGLGGNGCGGDNPADNNNNGGDNNNGGSNNNDGGGSVPIEKWMTNNLNVETADSWCYGEGGQVKVDGDWVTLTSSQIQANCAKYGRLYTWESAKAACLSIGKRLPTREEWTALVTAAGGESTAGSKLKSSTGWTSYGSISSTDQYGFSALPGGGHNNSGGSFVNAGYSGYWWTATEYNGSNAYGRIMYYSNDYVGEDHYDKSHGRSVRCVEDA
jgi:uncharacterized protein (TIGR02145 family)